MLFGRLCHEPLYMIAHSTFYGSGLDVFWGEIHPCEHLVQIYDTDAVFLDTLEGFVAAGLRGGESVIVIATPSHLQSLNHRLHSAGLDLASLRARDQYVPLNAEETLAMFMKDGWPDEERFSRLVKGLVACARRDDRKVRAFGEMVALLWASGQRAATVRLEELWQQLCTVEHFSLLCAYPRVGFTQGVTASMADICAAHSRSASALSSESARL